MKPHHRAFIIAGLITGLPAFSQGASQAPAPQPQQGTASQQGTDCTCPMMGEGGMMHGGGMHGQAGMSCPMSGMADVAVEQTPSGAVLRFTAKDPAKVADVQRMAQMMERCMSARGAQQAPAAPGGPTQRKP